MAILAGALTPVLPTLPDGVVGSPRAVLTAVIVGLGIAALIARGKT
jgi:hypothetical protein